MLLGRKYILALLLVFLVALPACGPTSRTVHEDYVILTDTSGLELDESQHPILLYKRPGAPTLAAYDRFIIDPIQVNYTDPAMKELDPEQIDEMQRYFQGALIKELTEAGYEVGTRSEAKTLRMTLILSGLTAWGGGGAANVGTIVGSTAAGVPGVFSISVGQVTIEGVFREALTNRIDAVVVERSGGSHVLNTSPWSTRADVEKTFDNWAEGIRAAIDKAHGREVKSTQYSTGTTW